MQRRPFPAGDYQVENAGSGKREPEEPLLNHSNKGFSWLSLVHMYIQIGH